MIKAQKKGEIIAFRDLMNVFCVIPRVNNERIKKQAGAFLIYGLGPSSICKLQDFVPYLKYWSESLKIYKIYMKIIKKNSDIKHTIDNLVNVSVFWKEVGKYFSKTDEKISKCFEDSIEKLKSYNSSYDDGKDVDNQYSSLNKDLKNLKEKTNRIIVKLESEIYDKDIIPYDQFSFSCGQSEEEKVAFKNYLIKQNIIEILSAAFWEKVPRRPRLIMKEEVKVEHGKKEEILEGLSKIGISEETLFPELEHYAESLKRKARERKMNRGKKKK